MQEYSKNVTHSSHYFTLKNANMKQRIHFKILVWLLSAGLIILSCKKEISPLDESKISNSQLNSKSGNGHLKQTKTFSSDVVVSWLNMQLSMFKIPLPAGTGSQATDRCQAYCGIALYESVVPGMPAYQTLHGQLTDFPLMPSTEPGKAYHWAASANAALAEMNRRLFPTTAVANKTAMTNLENTWQAVYAGEVDAATLQRSIAFGKEVATRVFNWAAMDGSAIVNIPYPVPIGFGLWVPTAPPPAQPGGPYTYQRRLMVPGVATGTALAPPPTYSTTAGSPFWIMANEVYIARNNITGDQKAMVDYFKDVPGYSPGGTYVALMTQALDLTKPMLDMAALTYVKVGLAQHDVTIVLFTNKYQFNTMRPVTYIRANIDAAWSPYIPTPNFPEFPAGHSATGGATIAMMSNMFGENFHFTLHTYDYLGYPPRSYTSFTQLNDEVNASRFYGGLHYRATCEKSTVQGKKVAENILATIKFLKG